MELIHSYILVRAQIRSIMKITFVFYSSLFQMLAISLNHVSQRGKDEWKKGPTENYRTLKFIKREYTERKDLVLRNANIYILGKGGGVYKEAKEGSII